jgi:GNAT superfamily N-acetyltransferase
MDNRPAVPADIDGIAATRLSNGPAHHDSGANPEYCRFLIDHGHLWVAVDDLRVVGFGGAIDVADARLLSDLYVRSDAHGRGIGSALLGAVLGDADATFTFASNQPAAQAIYARAGMVATWTLSTWRGRADHLPTTEVVAHEVDVIDAARFEQQHLGVDHGHVLRYWAARVGNRVVALRDERGECGMAVVHVADDWVRIEHLVAADHRAQDSFVATVAFTGAVAVEAYVPEVRALGPALRACGFEMVDNSVFMTSRPGVVGDDLQVLHPGLC